MSEMEPTSFREDNGPLAPGTEAAWAAGCRCQYRDDEPPDNDIWPNYLVQKCPIHGASRP